MIARAETLAREGAEAHLAAAVERWFSDAVRVAHLEVLEKRRRQSLANHPACHAAAYRILAGSDLGAERHRIALPARDMTGEHDSGASPRMARLFHHRIAGAELRILPGLRHGVLLEPPDLVASHLDRVFRARLAIWQGAHLMTEIRKLVAHAAEARIEGGRAASPPLVIASVASVLAIPWAGRGFVEDCAPRSTPSRPSSAPRWSRARSISSAVPTGSRPSARPRSSAPMARLGSALTISLRFGILLREALGRSAFIPFTNTRCGRGSHIPVPLKHIAQSDAPAFPDLRLGRCLCPRPRPRRDHRGDRRPPARQDR
ncbi:hypothetical protein LNKW23_37550 [Paralimibaculum aggregatum]|uniref:Serine aminopeptidase S33 domain-containing protein n=1 Tax=Paralimibaculum aggregatum TaxID=3036245 RepID=A0ABQ6LRY4_9RHOB|nr:hypothetical protein LNKW23_37550 [Limibaculum sp. NKW23]